MRIILVIACLGLMLGGCAMKPRPTVSSVPQQVRVPSEDGLAVYNLALSRTYMFHGRYELARERLLLALSSARTETMRQELSIQLAAVDRAIASRR